MQDKTKLPTEKEQDTPAGTSLAKTIAEVLSSHPQVTQTFNFNAPIGQQIAHVDKIEAHFDKDMGMQVTMAGQVPPASTPIAPDASAELPPIPGDCREAERKVVTPDFKLADGTVLHSRQQLIKAARLVDTTDSRQLAMLIRIGMEAKAINPGANMTDCVKALAGLRIIAYRDAKSLRLLTDGVRRQANGYTHKGKVYPALPRNRRMWNSADQALGQQLYAEMTR